MEIVYKYRESLKEYTVEENGYYYYMPYSYIQLLESYLNDINVSDMNPVERWYGALRDLERKVVSKMPKDQEKLSSV